MPWKKLLVTEARVQFVLAAKNRSESFASLCDHFGLSGKSGDKWLQRYRAGGVKALADASRRLRHRRKMHHFVLRMRLRKVRQEHPRWGAKEVATIAVTSFPWAKATFRR